MDEREFLSEIAAHVSGRVGVSSDILLYVHGFNTSLDEARFRIAQIVADGRFYRRSRALRLEFERRAFRL